MRIAVLGAAICLSVVGLSAADDSKAAIRKDTNIPAGGLGPALQTLAKTYDFQVLYRTEVVGEMRTQGAAGTMTAPEALKQVLSGTGLSFKYLDDNTVTIISVATSTAPQLAAQSSGGAAPTQDTNDQQKEGKKSSSGGFLLAQVAQGAPTNSPTPGKRNERGADTRPVQLEEVIVTAQKRNERLQDVPVPVTAIGADTLVDTNQLRLQDYYTNIPGLNVTPNDLGAPFLTIRGLTTGGVTNPTVGIVVDDVPYGSSSALVQGEAVPDIDPGELSRVEVLRGPQGTLYGASSIGGLLKFVTVDPSPDAVAGRLQAGISSVHNGAQLGYNVRGAVNLSLSDTVAMRASGFTRQDPGYIDNPVLDIRGLNEQRVSGGRLSALWRPSQVFSLKLSVLYQDAKSDGSSAVDLQSGLGDLQQNNVRGTGGYNNTIQAYSATLTAKLGVIDLTSVSGYSVNRISESYDYTNALGLLTQAFFGVTGSPFTAITRTTKFTQEWRLSGSIGASTEWLFGAFYNHEDSPYNLDYLAVDSATGAQVGNGLHFSSPFTFAEYAAFTDLTYHFTERFDIQIGGRESHNRQTYTESFVGIYDPVFFSLPSPVIYPKVNTKENSFTYLVTPRFKVNSDLMMYARLASGYRPGGPNESLSPSLVPPVYNADKTQNYEIGVKGNVLAHALSFDASVYYIDWKDIQLQLRDPRSGGIYFSNGSRAKSQGVELSVESKPLTGMTIAGWVAWNDAALTEALPPTATVVGAAGDRLPDSSRFSGNFSVEQSFALTSSVTGFAGLAVNYLSDRQGVFLTTPRRQYFPAYAKTDLRAGLRYESWTANVFVNNVADRRGVLSGGLGTLNPVAFTYIQPRTVGMFFSKTF